MVDNTTLHVEHAQFVKPGVMARVATDCGFVLSVPANDLGLGIVGEGPDAKIRIHLVFRSACVHADMDAQNARLLMANIARALEFIGADGSTN